jgi:hypothetical protein
MKARRRNNEIAGLAGTPRRDQPDAVEAFDQDTSTEE